MSATVVEREPLCERSWLPESTCAHCLGHTWDPPALGIVDRHWGLDPEVELDVPYTYRAESPTRCGVCQKTIRVGEVMGRDENLLLNACAECIP